ncbi:class I SAM-dependent methyltransferase [Acidocella aromatica]|uniref:Ubiquinone/menaquinone biosynthesis C-methylase UbiE n=1 Tax=Acidocella aromatica TaxID=1303579 RepID=A0A840VK26_9PROT|nr:methyltransferase domain-containing protein [Acidocella aromatica]MBB5373525.1 ubiquinone/menaquinone biosynthesis C-methylase UbiE [Acidocella aromatica]
MSIDDIWSAWLRRGRDGGDARTAARVAVETGRFAAKILDAVELRPGMALLDIGSGEGLMAWAALERCPALRVLLTDVSEPMLRQAEETARHLGVAGQCRFLHRGGDSLSGVEDASLDVVTSRSALAYVADKDAAFREIFRVLKPGGRLSLAEPLFREEAEAVCAMRRELEAAPQPMLELLYRWKAAQYPYSEAAMAASAIASYTERDLLRLAAKAGFGTAHLELHIDIAPTPPRDWGVFCAIAPHPLAPSLRKIMAQSFTPEEAVRLEAFMRPRVEAGQTSSTRRMIYLSAEKPGAG